MYIVNVRTAFTASITTTVSLQSGRIGADEVIDDTDGKAAEELEERLKEKEAKTQAILLEMVRRRERTSFFNWRCAVGTL